MTRPTEAPIRFGDLETTDGDRGDHERACGRKDSKSVLCPFFAWLLCAIDVKWMNDGMRPTKRNARVLTFG